MKRIVIHAGPGKTGTSVIQHWLSQHEGALAEQGVFYPGHSTDVNDVSSGNLHVVTRNDDGQRPVVDDAKVKRLITRFEKSRYHTLLLSSEFFFFRILDLQDRMPNAEFVVYLRNPIELAESGYNQGVKRHRQTKTFRIGEHFNSPILGYLRTILEETPAPSLTIRPYSPEHFREGNIVSDLLLSIGIDTSPFDELGDIGKRRVNPSYTLEALEFKRCANHFEIDSIQAELDRKLQACPVGSRHYSLIHPHRYEQLKTRLVATVADFVDSFDLDELRPFCESLTNEESPPHHPQEVSREQLQSVADYLAAEAPELLEAVGQLVRSSSSVVLPNPDFFAIFGAEFQWLHTEEKHAAAIVLGQKLTLISQRRSRLRLEDVNRRAPDALREIADYFAEQGDLESAILFIEAAYKLRPGGEYIRRLMNTYRSQYEAAKTSDGET